MQIQFASMASWLGMLCLAFAGCAAAKPYKYGRFSDPSDTDAPSRVVVEHGKPNVVLDGMSDVLSLPFRLLAPQEPDYREVTAETTDKVRAYLEENDLADVHVAVRQYSPRAEWRRLRENKHLGWVDRSTLGALSVVHYTIWPARLWNYNHYNPYTNTLYVNSEFPGLVLGAAAYAKNTRRQRVPGLYALASEIPVLGLLPAVDAGRELIGYARHKGDWDLEMQVYPATYAVVGIHVASGATAALPPLWPVAGLATFGGGMAGELAGRHVAARREAQRDREMSLEPRASTSAVQQAVFDEPVRHTRPTPESGRLRRIERTGTAKRSR